MDLAGECRELLEQSFPQAEAEGCDPAEVAAIHKRAESLGPPETEAARRDCLALVDEIEALPVQEGFAYEEPNEFDEIVTERPEPLPGAAPVPGAAVLRDKVLGAWRGRCAGCMLGKPVEGRPRAVIEPLLRSVNAWPLDDYFPRIPELPEGVKFDQPPLHLNRGHIDRAVRDDDTDYPIAGLKVLERKGRGFAPEDVADEWLASFPYGVVYTAERVAYRNLVNGLKPPQSARFRNPYREWIGAQIRADIWGWVNPGDPARAAEYAYRDACISHTKNGIYGALFFAAAIAQAFVTDDPGEVIEVGLAAIPANCRLARAVEQVVEWCEGLETGDWERVWEQVTGFCGDMHWIHTINNAMMVVMAVLLGQGDFTRTISIAVMAGLDTDCNGATAGSVLGAMLGAGKLPAKWVEPLGDRLESAVSGEHTNAISELAARTVRVVSKRRN